MPSFLHGIDTHHYPVLMSPCITPKADDPSGIVPEASSPRNKQELRVYNFDCYRMAAVHGHINMQGAICNLLGKVYAPAVEACFVRQFSKLIKFIW